MFGLMQQEPLLVSSLIEHADQFHKTREIVTRTVEGPIHRYSYMAASSRSKKLAKALLHMGVEPGDRVGTLAWNTHRHVEAWYAISGIGAITHTINPRLFADQIAYIVNHAENEFLFVDLSFVSLLEGLQDRLKTVKGFIVMTDSDHMPQTSLRGAVCYEELIANFDDDYQWPKLDERTAAAMCYTSGTTGNPKGVLYSNRSCVLHAMASVSPDLMGAGSTTVFLPVVPMFHANGWGIPHAAPMVGSKMVLPGAMMDGASIYELLDSEKVNLTAAVPTVWLMLLAYLEENDLALPHLDRVVIGGSAAPRSMIETFEQKYGVEVRHAWGMTEMNPLGSMATPKAGADELPYEQQLDFKSKQGRGMFGVRFKITDDDGNHLEWNGSASGHLMVKGPWVVDRYYRDEGGDILDEDGYFDTGDIANIDEEGFIQLTDRAKDVIKSGGEWISSIDLENAAVGHPDIAEAAVIGVYHPKWDERPLLIVVRREGADLNPEDVLEFLRDKVAKWWLPDDVVFVDELPHTATGKLLKTELREQFKDHRLPS